MVESERIINYYIQLLDLIKNEAEENNSIWEYYNYLNVYKIKFLNELNVNFKEELKEFLRGANRYSDEFSFSDKNYFEIRSVTNTLYDILNNKTQV